MTSLPDRREAAGLRRRAELDDSQIIRRPTPPPELPAHEQQLAALATLFEPAAALSRIMGLGVDDVQRLATLAYFREYRRRGLSLRQIAKRIGKSLRTVATLSKTASDTQIDCDDERIELLRDVLRGLTHAVYRNFFREPDDGEAWAGFVEVRLPADRMREVRRRAWQALSEVVSEAEAEARDAGDHATVAFYFVERPTDLPWRERA
jgi:transcriptional regulator with XRE-family HTH domain